MFRTLNAIGAYGRKAELNDWKSGKDFYSLDHEQYFSIRDSKALLKDGFDTIQFLDIRPYYPVLFSVEL
jgi:hypothetical protein